jgi:hypothetical protein
MTDNLQRLLWFVFFLITLYFSSEIQPLLSESVDSGVDFQDKTFLIEYRSVSFIFIFQKIPVLSILLYGDYLTLRQYYKIGKINKVLMRNY